MDNNKIVEALRNVKDPSSGLDIIQSKLVHDFKIDGNNVVFSLLIREQNSETKSELNFACIEAINRVYPDANVHVHLKMDQNIGDSKNVLPQVKNIIAVASGKGGVGKSTVAANLAAGMAKAGYRVGLIDADIYGPSQPIMFDVAAEKPGVIEVGGKQMMTPVSSYGVKILSIGFFVDIHQAIVWRGPMTTKALNQMVNDVHWGELDFLFLDLPPGTGDVHLTIVQSIPLSGAVVVSTPQTVALADARKGVNMFQMPNINVPVLGIIENMAWFTPEERLTTATTFLEKKAPLVWPRNSTCHY